MEIDLSVFAKEYFSLVEQVESGEDVKVIYDRVAFNLHEKYQPVDVLSFDRELTTFLHNANVLAYKNEMINKVMFDKILEELPLE